MRGSLLATAAALVLTSGPAWAQISTVYTVDTGALGRYSSVAYGTDGLPLISYYDAANGDLKVAHCLDVACAASTKQTIDSAAPGGDRCLHQHQFQCQRWKYVRSRLCSRSASHSGASARNPSAVATTSAVRADGCLEGSGGTSRPRRLNATTRPLPIYSSGSATS